MKRFKYTISIFVFALCFLNASGQDENVIISADLLLKTEIYNLEAINTQYHEFSPSFYKDGILYVSKGEESEGIDEDTGEQYWDLFYAVKDENKQLVKLGRFSDQIDSPSHEGPAGFNSDQDVIYFTRNRNIYSSINTKGKWNNPRVVKISNEEFYYCHPTLRADDRAMIFSSNLPGGFGKMDLYISFWNGNSWSLPQNLGPTINTSGNELFPFWHSSGMLFFASDGLPERSGGLDIFASVSDN
jgi:hypothetical protein